MGRAQGGSHAALGANRRAAAIAAAARLRDLAGAGAAKLTELAGALDETVQNLQVREPRAPFTRVPDLRVAYDERTGFSIGEYRVGTAEKEGSSTVGDLTLAY